MDIVLGSETDANHRCRDKTAMENAHYIMLAAIPNLKELTISFVFYTPLSSMRVRLSQYREMDEPRPMPLPSSDDEIPTKIIIYYQIHKLARLYASATHGITSTEIAYHKDRFSRC
ncbi:hypothetical protein N7540_011999 [Penicillium herquei]|nr:hypothetical protein N7540_011999 [Penicillium herquei]